MASITINGADDATALNSESTTAKEASAHGTVVAANKSIPLAGSAFVDLAADDDISLIFLNETGSTDIVIEHANVTVTMVGGT